MKNNKIYPYAKQEGGSERFMNIKVIDSQDIVQFEESELDPHGKNALNKHIPGLVFKAYIAKAEVSWKDDDNRLQCIKHLKKNRRPNHKNRWENVLENIDNLKNGKYPPTKPIFVLPTGKEKVQVIDGTRRIVSYIEFGISDIEVILIK